MAPVNSPDVILQHLPFSPVSLIDSENSNENTESVLCWIKGDETTCGASSQTWRLAGGALTQRSPPHEVLNWTDRQHLK